MRRVAKMIIQPKSWLAVILIIAFSVPVSNNDVEASSPSMSGFVVHADQIGGQMMLPGAKVGSGGQPMLTFKYASATIQGLTMTKELETPNGSMTVKITAPLATAENMEVDATGFSAGGACLKLGKMIPEPNLKNVTLVAHQQKASSLQLKGAQVEVLSGHHGVERPGLPKVMEDLSGLAIGALKDAIEDLLSGQAPLTCDGNNDDENNTDKEEDGGDPGEKSGDTAGDAVDDVTDELEDGLGDILDPDNEDKNSGDSTDEVKDTVDDVVDDVEDTVNGITKETLKLLDQLLENTRNLLTVTTTLLDDILQTDGKLANVTDGLVSGLIKPVRQLVNNLNVLNARSKSSELENELEKVEAKTKKLNGIETKINDYKSDLDQYRSRLNHAKDQLSKLENRGDAPSSQMNKVKNQIAEAQDDITRANDVLGDMERDANDALSKLKKLVNDVNTTVDDLGEGLFGTLAKVLGGVTNILGNLTKLLGIK